ncbi:MAG: (Fe-S)-binding protein [Methylococcales bacterium]|nr:(Fe-S)-binding protein [Methylococcales bacterium]
MFDFMDEMPDDASYCATGPYIPEAIDCMRCGLCVSHCPTYQLFQAEVESPRSRVRTLDKIINGLSPISDSELKHLNNCTQCRRCETVCPSKMAYGQLFDRAQAIQQAANPKQRPTGLAKLGYKFIEHKNALYLAAIALRCYQTSGIQYLLRKSRLLTLLNLEKAEALLPKVAIHQLAKHYPTSKHPRGKVGLFTGCISNHFDRETLLASIKLLNYLGFDVFIPKQQGCCGAIHQHQGYPDTANKLAAHNIGAFNGLDLVATIYVASGCGLMLHEYDPQGFDHPLYDITSFLNLHWPADITLKSPAAKYRKFAVHEPCSQQVQKPDKAGQHPIYALLGKIPGITVAPLPDNQVCCGAGGIHILSHPAIAEPLRDKKLAHFKQTSAELLVTTNIGCALHLNAGPALHKVVHPVVLLAEALG